MHHRGHPLTDSVFAVHGRVRHTPHRPHKMSRKTIYALLALSGLTGAGLGFAAPYVASRLATLSASLPSSPDTDRCESGLKFLFQECKP
ncbi:MAG: hypothetical protein HY053_08715 [Proteobacteria bacterium]|nr:hypothetical protein [Pseudomonadota bacterium]